MISRNTASSCLPYSRRSDQVKTTWRLIFSIAVFLLSPSCFAQDIFVEAAWVRMGPPAAMSLAGYMTINNQSDSDVSIVSVSSPDFSSSMIHQTVIEDGLAKMRHHDELRVPAGQSVSLEPNGFHLMLMQPDRPLEPGDKVELVLEFSSGEIVVATVPVRAMTP